MSGFDPRWIAAARFERDRRARSYPRLVAEKKLDHQAAEADYQAWCYIAEWMETGKCALIGGWSGEPDFEGGILTWAFLEESAAKAVAGIDAKIAKDEDDVEVTDEALAITRARREVVSSIHGLMVRQRELVTMNERLTAEARRRWAKEKAEAA